MPDPQSDPQSTDAASKAPVSSDSPESADAIKPKSCCTPQGKLTPAERAAADSAAGSSSTGQAKGAAQAANAPLQTSPINAVRDPIRHANTGDTANMVELPGGPFLMGTDYERQFKDDAEGPVREVTLNPFFVDTMAVDNRQFKAFVDDTKYVTEAEQFGWSFAFRNHLPKKFADKLAKTNAVVGLQWWIAVPGASWKRPEGERSTLKGREDHPAVHVSFNDAIAFSQWAGKRLPTEAEWEYAARGGLEQKLFPWGDQLTPLGKHRCNVWQGRFPQEDTGEDGYTGTCPVDAFKPNALGLYNVAGNVWEWVNDWFSTTWHVQDTPATRNNPWGADTGDRKVQKGGSFLCHLSYCNRYRVAARMNNTPDSSASNSGFRCVRDV